jgi:hypothetical protein
MKLLNIIKELEKPEQVYSPGQEPEEITNDITKLTPQQQKELFNKGSIIIGNQVIYLPKMDKMRKNIFNSKKEFEAFLYYPDSTIKEVAKEINKLHNQLYKYTKALDKLLELRKSGK